MIYIQTSEIQNELVRHSSVGANGKYIIIRLEACVCMYYVHYCVDKAKIIPQHLYKVKSSSSPDMFELQDNMKKPHK